MEERTAGKERQRPDGRQQHDPFGSYFGSYAGAPTRVDDGRSGAPAGDDAERGRPAGAGSIPGDPRPADGADDEPTGPTIP